METEKSIREPYITEVAGCRVLWLSSDRIEEDLALIKSGAADELSINEARYSAKDISFIERCDFFKSWCGESQRRKPVDGEDPIGNAINFGKSDKDRSRCTN